MASKDYVLVIGSAHVDVLGDYSAAEADRIDKEGRLLYAVGGAAFNVSMNLRQAHVPTALYTVLKKGTFVTDWIQDRLSTTKVIQKFVVEDPHIQESGFIAHMQGGVLRSAVSCMAVQHWVFDEERLEEAIGGARLLLVDCNLSPGQLRLVFRVAGAAGKLVVVMGVSESKAQRVRLALPDDIETPIGIFVVNRIEAEHTFGPERMARILRNVVENGAAREAGEPCVSVVCEEAHELCREAGASTIVVTRGAEGHVALTLEGEATVCAAPPIQKPQGGTSLGAGDAFCAGIAEWMYFRRPTGGDSRVDWKECLPVIGRHVQGVLAEVGATHGATAGELELQFVRKEDVVKIDRWEFWKVWGPVVTGLLSAAAGFLGAFLGLE